MKKLTKNQQNLYNQIDEILWRDWDPIGVNEVEEARDEYQSYTPHLFSLAIHGADYKKIANHLFNLERDSMGCLGNYESCEKIAKKIVEMRDFTFKIKEND